MNVALLVMALVVAVQDVKPVAAKGAIKKADRIVSIADIERVFLPEKSQHVSSDGSGQGVFSGGARDVDIGRGGLVGSRSSGNPSPSEIIQKAREDPRYEDVLERIRISGVFNRPLKGSIVIRAIKSAADGGITLRGELHARKGIMGHYLTPEQNESVRIGQLAIQHAEHGHANRLRDLERMYRGRPARGNDAMADAIRHHLGATKALRDKQARLMNRLSKAAEPRQHAFEYVDVSLSIPAPLAEQINMVKLAGAKRILVTMTVTDFDLQPPIREINKPAAIGSLTGTAVTVARSFLKKK